MKQFKHTLDVSRAQGQPRTPGEGTACLTVDQVQPGSDTHAGKVWPLLISLLKVVGISALGNFSSKKLLTLVTLLHFGTGTPE